MIDTIDRRKPLGCWFGSATCVQSALSPGELVRIRNRDIIEFVGGDTQPEPAPAARTRAGDGRHLWAGTVGVA